MFSIRKLKRSSGAMIAAMAVGILAGCQSFQLVHFTTRARPPYPERLDTTPITTDGAMAERQWDVSVTGYANDAVVTQPTYTPLQLDQLAYEGNAIFEPVNFIVNTFYLPIGLVVTPPWTWQVNKSLSLPQGYTLMPVLPEGPERVPTY